VYRGDDLVEELGGPAGAQSCSYSAEGWAVVEALRWLRTQGEEIRGKHIRFASDSQSFLAALETGPNAPTQWLEAEAWRILHTLTSQFKVRLRFVFVFAHCGLPRGDRVDELASAALDECGLEPVPLRPCDCVNARTRRCPRYPGEERQTCRFRRDRRSGNPLLLAPEFDVDDLNLSRDDEVLLFRLRQGCCPLLGSVFHDNPSACRRCGDIVMCRAAAVRHIFSCRDPAVRLLLQRLRLPPSPSMLWSHPRECIELARLFGPPPPAAPQQQDAADDGDDADAGLRNPAAADEDAADEDHDPEDDAAQLFLEIVNAAEMMRTLLASVSHIPPTFDHDPLGGFEPCE
jgi:ribonuclease HI